MKNKKTGFTLIELLVVIAVIGILAATLLVGYSGVRDRAKDARAIAGMSQLRVVAESHYSSEGKYTGFQYTDAGEAIIADINKQVPTEDTIGIYVDDDKYCVDIVLNDDDVFCIDSTAKATKGEACNISAKICATGGGGGPT